MSGRHARCTAASLEPGDRFRLDGTRYEVRTVVAVGPFTWEAMVADGGLLLRHASLAVDEVVEAQLACRCDDVDVVPW